MPSHLESILAELATNHARGWTQIPVHGIVDGRCTCSRGAGCPAAGKHPVFNAWSKQFLSYEQLTEIFRQNPHFNLGIVTGTPSNLFVIDIDLRHEGLASIQKLESQGCSLPADLYTETGGGGYHLFYALPEGLEIRSSAGGLAPGIDIRGSGGMVVAPGSLHKSGDRYLWADTSTPLTRPGPAPDWLIKRLQSASAAKPELVLEPGRKFGEGTRHPPFLRFAGMLHRYGVDEDGVFAALSALDQQICDPPMGADEVRRIAQSSAKWQPQNESEIIDHKNYLALAKEYLQTRYMHREGRTLHYWQGEFLEWDGISYSQACPENIRADIVQMHARRKIRRKVGKETIEEPFKPDAKHGNEMLRALETEAILPAKTQWPSWIGDQQEKVLAVRNGLLDLQTRELLAHTPKYLGKHHVNVDHDPTATAPRWQAFLNTIWGDDPESIAVLQQIFGYLVAGGLEQQKMFLIMGPTRSGKGTIGAVLEQLVGAHNTVSPTLTGLAGSFGLEPLVDKRLALISDSRLGKRADQSAIVEKLLPYSAGEPQLVNRKYKSMATVRPTARFLFLTNELPGFFDASGALAARFVLLRMTKSFLGCEDPDLLSKLLEELPGILNWALAGYGALQTLGRFGVPQSAQVIHEEMREMTSQVGEFLRQQCVVEPGQTVTRKGLHDAYNRWLVQEQGWHTNVTMTRFVSELRAACPILGTYRPMVGGVRVRMWTGVGLKRPEIVKTGPVMPSAV